METDEFETTVTALFAWFVRVFRRINADQARFLATQDTTPAQYGLLTVLLQEDGLTFGELGRRTALHGSTVTGLVDRLEARGLVARSDSEIDRRQIHLYLTDEGRALLNSVTPIDRDGVLASAVRNLGPEETRHLLALVSRLGREMGEGKGDEKYGDVVPTLMRFRRERQEVI